MGIVYHRLPKHELIPRTAGKKRGSLDFIYNVVGLPTGFGPSATRLPFVSTTSTVTLELAVVVS